MGIKILLWKAFILQGPILFRVVRC